MKSCTQIANIAIWRYGKLRIRNLPTKEYYNGKEDLLLAWALSQIQDQKILSFLNELIPLEHKNRFSSLAMRVANQKLCDISSKDSRQLFYATELLLSGMFSTHTGRKGSISPVALSTTSQLKDSRYRNQTKQIVKISDDKTEKYSYICDLSNRYKLSPEQSEEISKIVHAIGTLLLRHVDLTSSRPLKCVPFSVDFLFPQGYPTVLEVHHPPRGIGALVPNIVCEYLQSEPPVKVIANAISTSLVFPQNGRQCSFSVRNILPSSAFMSADANALYTAFAACGLIPVEPYSRRADVLICNDVDNNKTNICNNIYIDPEVYKTLSQRASWHDFLRANGVPCLPSQLLRQDSTLNVDKLCKELGVWVAVKSSLHRPWWDRSKNRTRFLCLYDVRCRRVIQRWLHSESLHVEPLVTDSLGQYDHFGELRVFAAVSNESIK